MRGWFRQQHSRNFPLRGKPGEVLPIVVTGEALIDEQHVAGVVLQDEAGLLEAGGHEGLPAVEGRVAEELQEPPAPTAARRDQDAPASADGLQIFPFGSGRGALGTT